jgi:putative component of toxin-antitoxin plasmid stabilization module
MAEETFQGNQELRNEANNLMEQLRMGNMNPGVGTKNIGKGIFEARSRGGARIYFRNQNEGIEILGYSNKANQSQVINQLFKIY